MKNGAPVLGPVEVSHVEKGFIFKTEYTRISETESQPYQMYFVTFREYCDGSLWNPLTSIFYVPERIRGPLNVNWPTEMAWEDFPGEIHIDPEFL